MRLSFSTPVIVLVVLMGSQNRWAYKSAAGSIGCTPAITQGDNEQTAALILKTDYDDFLLPKVLSFSSVAYKYKNPHLIDSNPPWIASGRT